MRQIPVTGSLDEVVEELISIREQGQQAYAKFERVTLHSDNVDLESAYQQVYGMTKEQYIARWKDLRLSYYYNWTKALVRPELLDVWYKYLSENFKFENFENRLVGAVLIMEAYKENGNNRRNFTAIVKKRCHKNQEDLAFIKWIIGCYFKDSEELYEILDNIYNNFHNITRLSYANEQSVERIVDNFRF